jgi:hypothetical protein
MLTVKYLNGDIVEYKANKEELGGVIATSLEIEENRVTLIQNNEPNGINYFVFIQDSIDYPFNCWDNFFKAFTESFQGEIYNFPKYEQFNNTYGVIGDIQIMEKLLETEDPQEGLDRLLQACCIDGYRYSSEVIVELKPIIFKMIDMGALINFDIIMKPQYNDRDEFEEEMRCVTPKACMLYMLYEKYMDEINKYVDWDTVSAIYWEDMIDWDVNKLHQQYDYTEAYYRALKYDMEHWREYYRKWSDDEF